MIRADSVKIKRKIPDFIWFNYISTKAIKIDFCVNLWLPEGRKKGRDAWLFGVDTSTLLAVQHRGLCSGSPGSLGGRGVGGEWTRVCVAESLHCPPETVTVLFTGYIPRAEEPGFCPRGHRRTGLNLATQQHAPV